MAKTITAIVLVSSASNAASATTRGTYDCTGMDGGEIIFKITNGGTGPTVQCVANVLVAQKGSSMPAAASAGTADTAWKLHKTIGGGVTASNPTWDYFRFGPEVAYLEIEFTGNTGQAVTVECTGNVYVY